MTCVINFKVSFEDGLGISNFAHSLFCVGRMSERVFYEKLTKHLFIIWGDDDDDDEEVVNTFFIHVLPRR